MRRSDIMYLRESIPDRRGIQNSCATGAFIQSIQSLEGGRMTEAQIIQVTGIEGKTSFTSLLTWNPHYIKIWEIGNSIVLEFYDIKDEAVSVIFPDRESLASALKEVLKQIENGGRSRGVKE